jgi:hypothetical protein
LEKTWNSFSIAGNDFGETLADEVLPLNMKAAGPPWIFHKARDNAVERLLVLSMPSEFANLSIFHSAEIF